MPNTIFVDANVLLDIFDETRAFHIASKYALEFCIKKNKTLFTSCDLITTIYYISAKQNPEIALQQVQAINTFCEVIAFSNKEIEQTCQMMRSDKAFCDLEASIQYILAKKQQCDLILSNDKGFVSPEIKLSTTEYFCRNFGLQLH